MELITEIIALAVLVALSGFFSGVEASLMSVNMLKVRNLLKQGRRGSKALQRLKQKPDRWLIGILICNNVVNIAASALATYTATTYFGIVGVGVAAVGITLLILVFGEILPKTIAASRGDYVALAVAPTIEVLIDVLSPLIVGFEVLAASAGRLLKRKPTRPLITEDELRVMVEVGVEENVVDGQEREFIEKALDFSDIRVRTIMTPKNRMLCLNGELTVNEAVSKVNKTRFSRFPTYLGDSRNRNLRIVHIKDMLKAIDKGADTRLKDIAKKPIYTTADTAIGELFREMKRRRQHMAIVTNSDGNTEGLVTLENLIEEIVGEIQDEAEIPAAPQTQPTQTQQTQPQTPKPQTPQTRQN